MAEALGVATAVIQIVDAASKLKELWHNFKNAPDDLTDCVDYIEQTAGLLRRSKELSARSAARIEDETFEQCTQNLDKVLASLRDICATLQNTIKSHKRVGALKIVLKKDEIARGRRRLENARKLLSTAHLNLIVAIQLSQDSILNRNHTLLCEVHAVVQSFAPQIQGLAVPHPSDAHTTKEPGIAKLAISSANLAEPRQRKSGRAITVRFPKWLTTKCFELVRYHEMSALLFKFTMYNIIESGSPATLAVTRGDISKLQSLFSTGYATPLDRDRNGITLLAKAAERQQLDMTKFLIAQGASTLSDTKAWGFYLWGSQLIAGRLNSLAQIWAIIVQAVDEDDIADLTIYDSWGGPDFQEQWAEWLPFRGFAALPPEGRAVWAMSVSYFEDFDYLLGPDLNVQQVLAYSSLEGVGYVYLLTNIATEDMHERQKWSSVVRAIFEYDIEQGSDYQWTEPSMEGLIGKVWDLGSQAGVSASTTMLELWDDALADWIQYLKDLGIDILHYGSRESDALASRFRGYGPWRFVSLAYGSGVNDWKILLVPDGWHYEMAGEFWEWVENPELFGVPGSYLEDYTSSSDPVRCIISDQEIRQEREAEGAWRSMA